MSGFLKFGLPISLETALKAVGFTQPTPVQTDVIPLVLNERDVLATAQTGTGKTGAFAIPLIAKALRALENDDSPKPALIMAPTRELAEQIGSVFVELTRRLPQLRTCVVIGGESFQRQVELLGSRPAFVVGTPGRLIDQLREGNFELKDFGVLVIDEADRLLDMGFGPQINELVSAMPNARQTLLFSATLPPEIQALAGRYTKNVVRVAIGDYGTSVAKPIEKIKQDVVRMRLADKPERLVEEIGKITGSIIVFVQTKLRVERVFYVLKEAGHVVVRIHGDRSQSQRSGAIDDFRQGRARILVATDIAARGLDVPHIQHVINFDLPLAAEDYVHRIGRTARAGASGHSLAFVTPEEEFVWARIHKLMYGRYPDEFRRPGKSSREVESNVISKDQYGRDKAAKPPKRQKSKGKAMTALPAKQDDVSGRRPSTTRGKRPANTKREVPATGGNRFERRAQAFGAKRLGKK